MLLMSYITMVLDQRLLDPVIIKCNQEHFRSSKEPPCASRKGARAEVQCCFVGYWLASEMHQHDSKSYESP